MRAATDRLPRLLALVPWLRAHPGVALTEVAGAFGVSERQVRSDLDLLWVCGLPGGAPGDLIDLTYEGDRITVLDPQTLGRPLRLSADEALALMVAARALADVPGLSERDALDRALAKLERAVAAPQPRVQVALEPEAEVLAKLRRAQESGRRVHLRYLVEARDELTERDVDPMRLLSREGRWYLEGWCHRAEAVRLFRLDRVAAADVLDVPAAPPPEAVPRDLADGLYRPSPGDARVVLDLAPPARWVADYYPAEKVEERPDGGLRVALRTPDPRSLRRLVLRLGAHGRVVEPASLAAEVRDAAARALAAYEPRPGGWR
ncbi:MAG TPA: WYL domain-containing protein [Frankiaceae bacterium]|nr:WYL domain-containing protein [Frankiaceae bacterium]